MCFISFSGKSVWGRAGSADKINAGKCGKGGDEDQDNSICEPPSCDEP